MNTKYALSVVMGVFFAIPVYLICTFIIPEYAIVLSLLSGVLFCLSLSIILLIYENRLNKKYTEIEKNISSPIFYKSNGNFNLGNGKVKNGNIYFCEAGIVCVCIDQKPYSVDEILLQDIEQYEFDNIHFNIYTKDNRLFVITTPDAEKIIKELISKGWI